MQPFRDNRKAQWARVITPLPTSPCPAKSDSDDPSRSRPSCRLVALRHAFGRVCRVPRTRPPLTEPWRRRQRGAGCQSAGRRGLSRKPEARRREDGQEGSRWKRPPRRRLVQRWARFTRDALLALGLAVLSAPPVEALEIVGGAQPVASIGDPFLMQVMARHGGGRHGGARPGGARPDGVRRPAGGMHRPVHGPAGPCTDLRALGRDTVPQRGQAIVIRSTGRAIAARSAGRWWSPRARSGSAVPAGIGGGRAAPSRRAPRSGSSPRPPRSPGPARRRSRASAGTTPTRAGRRASGTPARDPTRRRAQDGRRGFPEGRACHRRRGLILSREPQPEKGRRVSRRGRAWDARPAS